MRDSGWGIRVALALVLLAQPSPLRGSGAAGAQPSPLRGSGAASPQPSPARGSAAADVSVPPIECWWKTDRSAVRVGEHFQLTLTCAVLSTDRVSVVVDESSLDPAALHLTPFEIVGGQRFRDILNAPRKFFQYQYTLRVLGEEFFGKEVLLPRLQVAYRVQNSLQGGTALQGRETQYSLVPVPIRVLSLVPPGTGDIRDTPTDTFGDVEARLFRSNVLLMIATVAFVLAGLLALMLAARAAVRRRATTAVRERAVSPFAVLRASMRELAAVRDGSRQEGWTSDLAGRAASAVRLAGAVALSRPVSQKQVDRTTPLGEGQVPAAPGFEALRGKRTILSAAVTPAAASANGHSRNAELWQALSHSLEVFTAARYARPPAGPKNGEAAPGGNGRLDGTALDAALAEGEDAIKRLRIRRILQFGRAKPHAGAGSARQTWAR
jgi:hypothetical protein